MITRSIAFSAVSALAAAGILLGPVAANASTTSPASNVNAAEVGVAIPDGGATGRTVTFPGGGTWDYGTNDGTYSNYFHKTKKHASSVVNGNGTYVTSKSTAANAWSKASVFHTWTHNQAFYRFV